MSDNLLLDLTPRQVEVMRQALRLQEEAHKRNGFKVLEIEAQEFRSHISNAVIDSQRNLTRA
jgi:hypothetical protein